MSVFGDVCFPLIFAGSAGPAFATGQERESTEAFRLFNDISRQPIQLYGLFERRVAHLNFESSVGVGGTRG